MIGKFRGTTFLRMGSVLLDIVLLDNYYHFEVSDTLLGYTLNTIKFVLTIDDYREIINKKIDFLLVTSDLVSNKIQQFYDLEINISHNQIVKFGFTTGNKTRMGYAFKRTTP